MAANGLSTGIDNKLTFIDANGVQQYALLENFTFKEDANVIKQVSMDGDVRHAKLHEGGSGSFTIQRVSNVMDIYFALQEAAYYQGVDQLPVTINQTIQEPDGSVSQYRFTNAVLVFEDGGNWSGTDIVKQRITFLFSRRIPNTN